MPPKNPKISDIESCAPAVAPARVHVIGGGTICHVRPHFALCAPAYGRLARDLAGILRGFEGLDTRLHLTRMAGGPPSLETNEDLQKLINEIVADPQRSIVFMTAAVCDFEGDLQTGPGHLPEGFGKNLPRLKTDAGQRVLVLSPAAKIIRSIRSKHAATPRKDIFLVACKTTTGASDDEMFLAGLKLLKDASANLVLVNDIHRRWNMIVTPEQARYAVGQSRSDVASLLCTMAVARAAGTFTRSTVVPGTPVSWTDPQVHPTLRAVVDHCIERGAYKDVLGRNATVGHFAQKIDSETFLTSRRSTNFNQMAETGLVKVVAEGGDRVVAHGSRPSVGGQSQRIIFQEHPDTDCIVHFHCPPAPGSAGTLPMVSQAANECGSHQCGQNTSRGLREVEPGIKVVYLDRHGPNIVFHHSIEPQKVIDYIDRTFDLSRHTGEFNHGHAPGLES